MSGPYFCGHCKKKCEPIAGNCGTCHYGLCVECANKIPREIQHRLRLLAALLGAEREAIESSPTWEHATKDDFFSAMEAFREWRRKVFAMIAAPWCERETREGEDA